MRVYVSQFRVLLTLLFAGAANAQETPPAEVPDAPPAAVADAAESDDDAAQDGDGATEAEEDLYDFDISDLDDQTYEEDDDGFVPTEEIPADEPIPFPTDI